jgi:hypothetical protein
MKFILPNIVLEIKSEEIRWAGNVARTEEEGGMHKFSSEKSEGKGALGRLRSRWGNNIQMNLQEFEWPLGTGWSWLRICTGEGLLCVR